MDSANSVARLFQDYGWYVATGAVIAYVTWKYATGPDTVEMERRRRLREARRRAERLKRNTFFKAVDLKRRSEMSRRRRMEADNSPGVQPSSSSTPQETEPFPQMDTKSFLSSLTESLGPDAPTFMPDSIMDVFAIARVQRRPLFVYLHAPTGVVSIENLRGLLGSSPGQYLSQNFICWAGTMRDSQHGSEGYELAKHIGIPSFTHSLLMVLGVVSDEGTAEDDVAIQVVAIKTAASFRSPVEVLQWAVSCQDAWGRIGAKRQMETSRARIVRDQNSEYEQALAQDEQRLQEERQARERAANIERKRAEAKQRAEQQKRLRQAVRDSLPSEPAQGEGVISLRIVFPDGNKKVRRFDSESSLKALFEYVMAQEIVDSDGGDIDPQRLRIVTRFPRKILQSSKGNLRDNGIIRDSVLCVEEIFEAN